METGYEMATMTSELKIKVPWGHISGKIWGSLSSPPILCVHGIQDNANTFDNLIPLLPRSHCYIAIDLPGHGFSSHYPSGLLVPLLDYSLAVQRVVMHFAWKSFIFMGHSLGGQIGFLFTGLYPEQIEKLIILDSVIPYRHSSINFTDYMLRFYKNLLELEQKMALKPPPSYSSEEALRRLTEGRPSKLTEKAAWALIARGVIRSGDGYSFSADQRLKFRIPFAHSKEDLLDIMGRIRCPMFFVRASETLDSGSSFVNGDFEKLFQDNLGVNYHYKLVKGSHDVHLNNPEDFASELASFIIKIKSSL